MKILLAIDGNSLAYRAFFAFRKQPLVNSKGLDVSGIFGFARAFLKAMRTTKATHVFCAFDRGTSGRKEVLKEYKSKRPKMPDALSLNIQFVKRFLDHLNVAVLEKEGYEADDVIASVVHRLKDRFDRIYILTSDKDMLQLVDDKVFVYDVRTDTLYDARKVKQKFGVDPEQIPDYLILVGDSIDNIPGVKGIGHRTAVEILSRYGSIENLRNAPNLRRKVGDLDKLIEMKENLTKLRIIGLEVDEETFKLKEPDREKLFPFLLELELFSIMMEFARKPPKLTYTRRNADLREDTPVQAWKGYLIYSEDERIYMKHRELLDMTGNFAFFDSKEHFSKHFARSSFDLLLADYLLDPELASRKSNDDPLEYMLLKYMGYRVPEDELQREMYKVLLVSKFKSKLKEELEKFGLFKLLINVEIPVSKVLSDMERRGIKVDTSKLRELLDDIDKHLLDMEESIYELAGEKFNINSPKQLSYILFQKLKLPPLKKTRTGYSTSQEVLLELSNMHELPKKIMEYRELYKLKTSYVENLLSLVDPKTGRIHPKFHQRGTSTGRISCTSPNIQNIPKSEYWGRRLRECFVADEGKLLVRADYSQIELRILAHVSQDPELIKAFKEDRDIHTETARFIFKTDSITPSQRRIAKAVNFGIIYGISAYGLAKQTGMSVEQAQHMIELYFERHTKVKRWMEETLEFARKNGFVRTILNRIRRIPQTAIDHPNRSIREAWERIAINSPIQGSASDIIKLAMIGTAEFSPIMQIHDELVFEVEESKAHEVAERISYIMENVIELSIPLKVDVEVSRTWSGTD